MGPKEEELQMPDQDLISAQQKEINRLREDFSQTANELESLKLRVMYIHEDTYM